MSLDLVGDVRGRSLSFVPVSPNVRARGRGEVVMGTFRSNVAGSGVLK